MNTQLGAFKHKATKKCIVKKNSKSDGFLAQHLFKKNIFTSLARGFPRSFVQKEGSLIPERHVARLENIAPESNQFEYYSKKLIAFIGLFLITCISLLRRYPAVFGIGSFALTTDSAVAACSNRIDENKQLQPPAAQTNHSVRHKASSALKSAFYLPARVLDFLVLNDHVVTPLLSGPRASSSVLPTSAPVMPFLTGEDSRSDHRDATSRAGKMEAAPSPTPLMTCQTESNGSASTSQTNLAAALPEAQISLLSSSPTPRAQMLDSDLLVTSEDPEAGRSRMIDSTLAGAGALGLLPGTQQHELLGGDSLGEQQLHVVHVEAAAAFNKFNLSIEKAVPAEAWPAVVVHLLPSWSVEEAYTLTWCGIVLGLLPIYQISLLLVLAATGGGRKSSTASEEPSTTSCLVSINPAEIAGGLQTGGINDNKTTFGAPSAAPAVSAAPSAAPALSAAPAGAESSLQQDPDVLHHEEQPFSVLDRAFLLCLGPEMPSFTGKAVDLSDGMPTVAPRRPANNQCTATKSVNVQKAAAPLDDALDGRADTDSLLSRAFQLCLGPQFPSLAGVSGGFIHTSRDPFYNAGEFIHTSRDPFYNASRAETLPASEENKPKPGFSSVLSTALQFYMDPQYPSFAGVAAYHFHKEPLLYSNHEQMVAGSPSWEDALPPITQSADAGNAVEVVAVVEDKPAVVTDEQLRLPIPAAQGGTVDTQAFVPVDAPHVLAAVPCAHGGNIDAATHASALVLDSVTHDQFCTAPWPLGGDKIPTESSATAAQSLRSPPPAFLMSAASAADAYLFEQLWWKNMMDMGSEEEIHWNAWV
ncbi:hypothetical protein CEUSTIGMA_g6514.t1 [Chlamydomonas eustigma]|uniref:Uncharacterized protein n=1 Tax=Chlamydomonas eustigma TaxID=1157962 RepID=A0A250X7L1_9CHLO|nr:hypothetical protein CEUSTIGMA_g6514.t1 [Chlamydomonas eustigma]|eukprot:GAX79074.1 hypothetical protein CEUSTIGMA_g6514.t1 [Chlamydomonas eustigma]